MKIPRKKSLQHSYTLTSQFYELMEIFSVNKFSLCLSQRLTQKLPVIFLWSREKWVTSWKITLSPIKRLDEGKPQIVRNFSLLSLSRQTKNDILFNVRISWDATTLNELILPLFLTFFCAIRPQKFGIGMNDEVIAVGHRLWHCWHVCSVAKSAVHNLQRRCFVFAWSPRRKNIPTSNYWPGIGRRSLWRQQPLS